MSAAPLLAVAAATLAGLYFVGQAGGAAKPATLPAGTPRFASIDGRDYRVTKLGGGKYRVERMIGDAVVTALEFGQDGPTARFGDPQHTAQLDADMQKFPPSLFNV